jgi:hypothetical protein
MFGSYYYYLDSSTSSPIAGVLLFYPNLISIYVDPLLKRNILLIDPATLSPSGDTMHC